MKSTCVRFSELKLERELEVALRIRAAIRGGVDHASGASERTNETIGVAEVDVVEEIDRLDAELALYALGEPELLEERGVGPPVTWPAQRVSLLIAEGSGRGRFTEDAQVFDIPDLPISVVEGPGLDFAFDVRSAGSGIGDAARVNAVVER